MATDAAGPQLPRPPPRPSTGNAGTRESTVRSTRRTSNRPPPQSLVSAPSGATSRQPTTNSLARAAAASASSSPKGTPTATSPTSEVRDELVRRIMPELRVLTERLVKTSVERSIASLLDRQRELEVKFERSGGTSCDTPLDFDAKVEAALAPLLAKQRALELMLDAIRHAEVRPSPPIPAAAQRPMTAARLAMGPPPDALAAAALSANALVDIPAELNGSRRKRMVVLLLVLTVVGILATVASLSVMSNMGAYP